MENGTFFHRSSPSKLLTEKQTSPPSMAQHEQHVAGEHHPDTEKSQTERRPEELTRTEKLKMAIPPVTGKAKLLPPAYLQDPMRAASTFKRKLRAPVANYKLVTTKRSRIASINLEEFLKDDKVWNSLKLHQQRDIANRSGFQFLADVEPLPNDKLPNIWKLAEKQEHLKVEDVVEIFQSDLRAGVLDLEFQADAKRAGIRRARGDFIRNVQESSPDESEEESSNDDSEMEDEEVGSEDPEDEGNGNILGKVKILIHED